MVGNNSKWCVRIMLSKWWNLTAKVAIQFENFTAFAICTIVNSTQLQRANLWEYFWMRKLDGNHTFDKTCWRRSLCQTSIVARYCPLSGAFLRKGHKFFFAFWCRRQAHRKGAPDLFLLNCVRSRSLKLQKLSRDSFASSWFVPHLPNQPPWTNWPS